MVLNKYKCRLIGVTAGLSVFLAHAGDLSIPNSFSSGTSTSASQMNANFSAVESAVDDNNTRIAALEGRTAPVFQGFSATTVNGAAGLIPMQQACSASFSGSKVCTTTEFANSVYNSSASNLSGNAWLLPDKVLFQTYSGSEKTIETNIGTEVDSNVSVSCNGWSSSGARSGTSTDSTGKLEMRTCSYTDSVACCK